MRSVKKPPIEHPIVYSINYIAFNAAIRNGSNLSDKTFSKKGIN